MFTRDPLFWRAGAVSSLVVMVAILIALTFNTLGVISAGGINVPAYTVINREIGYAYSDDAGAYMPTVGRAAPLFGRTLSESEAEAFSPAREACDSKPGLPRLPHDVRHGCILCS